MTREIPTRAVYTERPRSGPLGRAHEWVRIGTAHMLPDGSISVRLDALPIDGVLMIREEMTR